MFKLSSCYVRCLTGDGRSRWRPHCAQSVHRHQDRLLEQTALWVKLIAITLQSQSCRTLTGDALPWHRDHVTPRQSDTCCYDAGQPNGSEIMTLNVLDGCDIGDRDVTVKNVERYGVYGWAAGDTVWSVRVSTERLFVAAVRQCPTCLPHYRTTRYLLFLHGPTLSDTAVAPSGSVFRALCTLIEQGLTSHQTHYRPSHIGDDFYRSYDQTNSVKALKKTSWSCR